MKSPSNSSNPKELLARLDLLVTVSEDACDLIVELIGSGYSATILEFRLSGYLDDLHRQATNVRARAEQMYGRDR